MAEGNPTLALERGEKVLTPPAIWFQAHGDIMHDYKDTESTFDGNEPQRFCADYAKAGGAIALEYIDMERKAGSSPDLSKCGAMFGQHGGVHRAAREGLIEPTAQRSEHGRIEVCFKKVRRKEGRKDAEVPSGGEKSREDAQAASGAKEGRGNPQKAGRSKKGLVEPQDESGGGYQSERPPSGSRHNWNHGACLKIHQPSWSSTTA